jgi:hypothetical protein
MKMTKYFMMMIMAVTTLGLAACDDATTKTQNTQKAETLSGTVVERTTTTESNNDGDGNVKSESKVETTVDPKGLMNKETTTEESTDSQEKE